MLDPEQYVKGDQQQHLDAYKLLVEYIHLLKWRHSEDEVVLDIGCGPGDITCEVLKPLLPQGARLVGADVSEKMVNYAARRYPDTEFLELDIGTKKLPEMMQNAFDHVFSFNCLHYVQDKKQAMQNIYDLLKPGGDMFLYYVAKSPIFDAYPKMAKKDIWKSYMPGAEKFLPPYQNEGNVEDKLKKILAEVGFKFSVYNYRDIEMVFSNIESVSNFILGINVYYSNIPQELKQQYLEDTIRAVYDLIEINDHTLNMSRGIKMCHKYNIVFARKP